MCGHTYPIDTSFGQEEVPQPDGGPIAPKDKNDMALSYQISVNAEKVRTDRQCHAAIGQGDSVNIPTDTEQIENRILASPYIYETVGPFASESILTSSKCQSSVPIAEDKHYSHARATSRTSTYSIPVLSECLDTPSIASTSCVTGNVTPITETLLDTSSSIVSTYTTLPVTGILLNTSESPYPVQIIPPFPKTVTESVPGTSSMMDACTENFTTELAGPLVYVQGQSPSHQLLQNEDKKVQSTKIAKNSCRLWEFIRDLLLDPATNPSHICWENRTEGTFKIVQPSLIAHIWGMKKGNRKMTYEKLSRAMRYNYRRRIFEPVRGKRHVYKFGPMAEGWREMDQ